MPDIMTHILCGDEVIEKIHDEDIKNMVKDKIHFFHLGNQGPDIFFYYKFMSLLKKDNARELGELMHSQHTGDFFINGLNYIKKLPMDENDYSDLLVYLLGFMCHFGLDRNAHPYIYYFGGVYDRGKRDTFKYNIYHKKLEVIIDSLMLKEKKGIDNYKYLPLKDINIGDGFPEGINSFYSEVFEKLYKEQIDKRVPDKSYKDMKGALRLLYDPVGYKKFFVNATVSVTRRRLSYGSVSLYPRKIETMHDFLNKKHNPWSNPCSRYEVSNLSFNDLYNRAVLESSKMINASVDFIKGRISSFELKNYFPNLSYLTGKPTDSDCKMQYFKCIFEQ